MSKIVLTNEIVRDNYTEYVCEKYDIQNREIVSTEVPLLDLNELKQISKWNIGVICGNSGSGKSTVLKTFGDIIDVEKMIDYKKCICSQFPKLSEGDVCELLSAVGLGSVPTWLKRPSQLSNGEFARLSMALYLYCAHKEGKNMDDRIILIDEFTSVVNRASAISMSYSLQRYVRKKGLYVILATCHFDIFQALKPDWVFNLNKKDENGNVELEQLIYEDDEEYSLIYKDIDDSQILSEEMVIE